LLWVRVYVAHDFFCLLRGFLSRLVDNAAYCSCYDFAQGKDVGAHSEDVGKYKKTVSFNVVYSLFNTPTFSGCFSIKKKARPPLAQTVPSEASGYIASTTTTIVPTESSGTSDTSAM
jgi:hypothetical protein